MYSKTRRPGKFEGNKSQHVARVLYDIAGGGGTDDSVGDVSGGWYGLILGRHYAFIVCEDGQGFFTYIVFDSRQEARVVWDTICQHVEGRWGGI